MRIVTFNTTLIQNIARCWSCLPQRDVSNIIDYILSFSSADVVLLQEVCIPSERDEIIDGVSNTWFYFASLVKCGLLILSKTPMRNETVRFFNKFGKGALSAEIGSVFVCNTHLSSWWLHDGGVAARNKQLTQLREWLANQQNVVLGGDFNCSFAHAAQNFNIMSGTQHIIHDTWRCGCSQLQFDLVFAKRDGRWIAPAQNTLSWTNYSDHRAVSADVEFTSAETTNSPPVQHSVTRI